MIIAIGALVMCVLAGGVFWLWLQATHGEVGPALVATAISLAVIIGAMVLALKLQEPQPESWLREGLPVYASA
jgi:hypothetical protein